MSEIVRTYQAGHFSIDVPFTGEGYFNATVVAKPFERRPGDWLRTEEAQAYIQAIVRKCVIEQDQLVKVVSGSPETGGGTWMHPKLAIRFAQWLDPFFSLWCDEQIESILRREGLNVIAQPKVHALLRAVLHDIGTTRDAFSRNGLINQARALFAALGIPMPNIALVGKPADQTQLDV